MSDGKNALTVVICSDFAAIQGGQAKVAIESAIGLKKQGHHVVFFAATGPAAPALAEAGVAVHCLDQRDILSNPSRLDAFVHGIWNRAAARALARLLAGMPKGDTIIHVHGWAKALSPLIGDVIRRSGLPAVYTWHEFFLACPNGGFYNYQKRAACPLEPLSLRCCATHCDARSYLHKLWRVARLVYAENIVHLAEVFADFISLSAFQHRIVAPCPPSA